MSTTVNTGPGATTAGPAPRSGERGLFAGSAVRLAAYLGPAGEPRGYRAANAYCGRALTPPTRPGGAR